MMDQGGCVSEEGQGGARRWIKVGVSQRRGRAGPDDGQGGCVLEEGQGRAGPWIKVGESQRRGRAGPDDRSRWVCLRGGAGWGRTMDQVGFSLLQVNLHFSLPVRLKSACAVHST